MNLRVSRSPTISKDVMKNVRNPGRGTKRCQWEINFFYSSTSLLLDIKTEKTSKSQKLWTFDFPFRLDRVLELLMTCAVDITFVDALDVVVSKSLMRLSRNTTHGRGPSNRLHRN